MLQHVERDRRSVSGLCSVLLGVAVVLPISLEGQVAEPPTVAVDGVPCSGCLLQARLVTTIGTEADSVDISFASVFGYGASGHIYVGSRRMEKIFVYDGGGNLVRTIGGRGEGPGEFRLPRHIDVGPGDSLYLVDGTRELHVFAPSGTYVRSGLLPFSVDQIEVLMDGRIAAAADVRTPALAGLPVHLLDRTGKLLLSFGSQQFLNDPLYPGNLLRKIAVSSRGIVWSANRTVFERWDTSGRLTKLVQRHTALMPLNVTPNPVVRSPSQLRSDEHPAPRPVSKPGSGLNGLQFDSEGRMWTSIITGADDWNSRMLPPGTGITSSPAARDQLLDTVVDVLDVEQGTVLGSYRLRFGAWKMPAPGIVFRVRDAETHYVLEVWRLELRTP